MNTKKCFELFFFKSLIMILMFDFVLLAQIKEDQEKNEMLKDRNEITYAPENNTISVIEALINKYNGIGEIVNPIKSKILGKEENLAKKKKERDKIDQSSSFVTIMGVVESRVSEYAIINSNGSLYAIKSKLKPGNSFNGTVKYNGNNVTYNKPNGYSVAVSTYISVDGENPRDKYQKLSSEINTLETERKNFLKELKEKALGIIDKEVQLKDELIIENHYALGEEYFNKQDFENAYKEFEIVKNINENYKDVKVKIESSNNKNSTVKKSSVYKIVSPKTNNFVIGTSEGVYESQDGAKTWKLVASEGSNIEKLDVTENKIILWHPRKGMFIGKRSKGNVIDWSQLSVKYTVRYAPVKRKDGTTYNSKEYEVVQPEFNVEILKFFEYEADNVILIKYEGRSGVKEKGARQMTIEKNTVWGYFYIPFGEEWLRIPEKFISPDNGNSWIGYWGALFGDHYYSSVRSQTKTEKLIDAAAEYFEEPTDAINLIKGKISETRNVDENDIKIIDYLVLRGEERNDKDPVLVLTDYGLFKSCWDCELLEEIKIPTVENKPLSLFMDKINNNIIIIGYNRGGLKISKDNGQTWEGI